MASPLATEQPTINGAWQAFWAHVPTILLIWLATATTYKAVLSDADNVVIWTVDPVN
jgi:hypothetical protein